MCVKQRCFFYACFFLLAVSLHSEQWYRISETELTKLETLSRNWETDKRSLLSQVNELKRTAVQLHQDSQTLNGQLQTERNTRTTLQKSFEQSEQDRLKKLSEYETEIAALKQTVSDGEIALLKAQNQRNMVIFLLAGMSSIVALFTAFKLKKLFL